MWRNYFKTPFKDGYGIYIHDANGHPVADYIARVGENTVSNIIKSLNGEYVSDKGHVFTFDKETATIQIDGQPIIRMRGWGYLTGVGGCKLSPEKAWEVQQSIAEFICEQLNKTK